MEAAAAFCYIMNEKNFWNNSPPHSLWNSAELQLQIQQWACIFYVDCIQPIPNKSISEIRK